MNLRKTTPRHKENNTKFLFKFKAVGLYSWGTVVVKALRYKSEGPAINSRCRRVFFQWHLTVPCALGSTQPLQMSTRLILGVKAAGA
jgi:hypothetical protein